jgi:2-polyprenyl-3-methyl-5-hydroxy-6-metoxy-1,4-benzoquinol methylase
LDLAREKYVWTDEFPAWLSYVNPSVLKLLRKYGARRVLDAGSGNGHMAGYLSNEGIEITGIDWDPDAVAIAARLFPAASFKVGSFEDPPPETYDAVVSTEVVEHLYDPQTMARYCFEALKPGGIVLMSTPYHGFWKNLAIVMIPGEWDRHHMSLEPGGHIKFWTPKTLKILLEDAGFEVVEFAGSGRLPYIWKSMIMVGRKPER